MGGCCFLVGAYALWQGEYSSALALGIIGGLLISQAELQREIEARGQVQAISRGMIDRLTQELLKYRSKEADVLQESPSVVVMVACPLCGDVARYEGNLPGHTCGKHPD